MSSYHKFYNWLWFNNGYHAEHHFRPKMHWTLMEQFHRKIADEQRREGVRVITPPHALGLPRSNLPEKSRPLRAKQPCAPPSGTAECVRNLLF